ncbi:acylase [Roseivirga sp. UBA838]|uniref:acylase n=1 Tax=Roseivirga sp. UBA838 TaxID=1947393 RepID=UPI00257F6BF5|nr:acylase [Roseivirga sp. UBA838]|tara:strand:- start:3204 stop:5369 length:2166 start_codon:yes stop_codon:yes gene_type:complete
MKKLFFLLLIALAFACEPKTSEEVERWEEQAARVEIIRDDFGIPHIYGKSDADAVFGMLYAQCEDDFPRVERNYYWAIGRLAEVEGEQALYSDLRARLYMTIDEAKAHYESAPDWLKELCQAYADGINYYLHTHPEVKPKVLTRFEPWFPMFFFEGSIGGDIESVSTRSIASFYGENEATALADWEEPAGFLEEPKGSNGFALAGNLTASGNAMLLINPHTSFYFRGESQVVSEEGLNAYGATTWGQFFIYQGFNEKNGWMHTSTRVDFKDDFLETVEERNGKLQYKYGDEWRDVWTSEVTLKYKDGDEMKEKTFPLYRTHHGPITGKSGDKWVATALNWEPVDALIQSFNRTKTNNHEEFWEMMKIRRNSSNNTVYADADGNIAYYHGDFIPKRDPQFDYSRPVDGSDPRTDWQGMHSLEDIITIVNPGNGWIQNCNSTPFTAAAEFSPKQEDYPYYMAPDEENFRGIHAVRVLSQAKDVTLDGLIELAYDPYIPAFEKVIPALVAALERNSAKKQQHMEAYNILKNWDFATGKESVAMTLAQFYGNAYYRSGEVPREGNGMERFEHLATGVSDSKKIEIFETALAEIEKDFGTWKLPWGEYNRFQRLSGEIDLEYDDDQPSIAVGLASGRWGALASFGARSYDTRKIYGSSGNSFVAVVEFGDKVKAKSILAGGQSNDPNSPHFYDQAQRYADIKFKDVAFYKEDVLKRAEETYRPGKR